MQTVKANKVAPVTQDGFVVALDAAAATNVRAAANILSGVPSPWGFAVEEWVLGLPKATRGRLLAAFLREVDPYVVGDGLDLADLVERHLAGYADPAAAADRMVRLLPRRHAAKLPLPVRGVLARYVRDWVYAGSLVSDDDGPHTRGALQAAWCGGHRRPLPATVDGDFASLAVAFDDVPGCEPGELTFYDLADTLSSAQWTRVAEALATLLVFVTERDEPDGPVTKRVLEWPENSLDEVENLFPGYRPRVQAPVGHDAVFDAAVTVVTEPNVPLENRLFAAAVISETWFRFVDTEGRALLPVAAACLMWAGGVPTQDALGPLSPLVNPEAAYSALGRISAGLAAAAE